MFLKILYFSCICCTICPSQAQNIISISSKINFNSGYLDQYPDKSDYINIAKYGFLALQKPSLENYDQYFKVACSFWETNKIKKAKNMFLNIIECKEPYYADTQYHSSGTIYGYGSFSSSYKNEASIFLTKIYLKKKKFKIALQYLNDATKKYPVSYSCGTGAYRQEKEYDFLYSLCYEGLKQYDKALDLLLPNVLEGDDEITHRILKKLYGTEKIKEEFQNAEKSMVFTLDSIPSYSYTITGNTRSDSSVYYGGKATIIVFGRKVNVPQPSLKHGEKVTKEKFLAELRRTSFYLIQVD